MKAPNPDDFHDMCEDSEKAWKMITLLLDDRPIPRQAAIIFNLVGRFVAESKPEIQEDMLKAFLFYMSELKKDFVAQKKDLKSKSKIDLDKYTEEM